MTDNISTVTCPGTNLPCLLELEWAHPCERDENWEHICDRNAMTKNAYKSDIVLGEKYRDSQTGIEGIATAIYFFQHACERVQIEYVGGQDRVTLKELVFDAPRLVHIKTGQVAQSDRPGGPGRSGEGQREGSVVR